MKVVIAGGGVAALETLLALRDLAEERVSIELFAPRAEFSYRPLAVAEPFGLGKARRYDLRRIAEENATLFRSATLTEVQPTERRVSTAEAGSFDYDVLVLAVGAKPTTPLSGAITVQGPGYSGRFRTLLSAIEAEQVRQVTFAVPPGATWALPLYELALMTAARVEERGLQGVELRLVTPESAPLELFGAQASRAVGALLEQRGIAIHPGLYPAAVREEELDVVPADHPPVPAEAVVTLPQLHGPATTGLPHDSDGFAPVDLHGLVQGETDVYAAGDATVFPSSRVASRRNRLTPWQRRSPRAQALLSRRGNDQADGDAGIRTDRDVATGGLVLGGELRLGGVEPCERVRPRR